MTTDLQKTLERLYRLVPKGRKLGLERVQAVCAQLGNPERSFATVHVAGTNGKGSVCALVASMARAGGMSVGTYTSPHLLRFAERININGNPIDDQTLMTLLNRVMDLDAELTFFEVATIAAFLAFKEAGVELAVLEVGLGGRLDATNVIPPPKVAVITRIAFDHMAELGESLAEIAHEKAGVIKSGSKVVVGKLHPDALGVINARIAEVGAHLIPLTGPEPIPGAPLAYPRLALVGSNLAVAVTVGRELGIAPEMMAAGIEQTTWPGRNELLHRNGQDLTLLDCAHNPDGAVSLAHTIDSTFQNMPRRELALVFGALNTKNWRAMLRRLEQIAANRIFVAPPISKAVNPQEMLKTSTGETAGSIAEALARARSLVGSKGVVVITGSTFLVGAARALLLNLPADPPVDL